MYIRKSDSGIVHPYCCKGTFNEGVDSTYIYKNSVNLIPLVTNNPIKVNFNGFWYTIEALSVNSLDYYPKYSLAQGVFTEEGGFPTNCLYDFTFVVDSGYLWYHTKFQAYDGSAFYWHASEVVNNNVYITRTAGTCVNVTLGTPGHCVNIKLMPCDSLSTLFVNILPLDFAVTNPSMHFGGIPQFYRVFRQDPQFTTCAQNPSMNFIEIGLGPNDLDLNGSKKDNSVLLNWTVSTETKYHRYDILKSEMDGKYYKIGSKQHLLNQEDYFFQDKNFKSSCHYKIKAYDIDNKANTSNTVFFAKHSSNELSISPNPTNGIINITGIEKEDYKYKVSTLDGRILAENHFSSQGTAQVDISSLAKGMYIISLQHLDTGIITSKKIMKE